MGYYNSLTKKQANIIYSMVKHGFIDIDTSKVYDIIGIQQRDMDSKEENIYIGIYKVLQAYLSEDVRDPEVLQGIYEGTYIKAKKKVGTKEIYNRFKKENKSIDIYEDVYVPKSDCHNIDGSWYVDEDK